MGEHLREVVIASETVYSGRVLTIRVDTVRLPDGMVSAREVVEHRGAVAMVPMREDGRVLLVRQWRNAAGRALLEIPAGGLEPGETPEECAIRETMEEVGYHPRKLRKLNAIYLAPGYSAELLHIFLAEDLVLEHRPGDDDERLEVVAMTWEEIDAALAHGEFKDAKTVSGLYMARQALR